MDVEGFEFDVIKSFGERLRSVKVLFVEINGLSDLRSHGQQEIVDYLNEHDFIGPLLVDFDERTFADLRNESKEDAIFVSKKFMTEMLESNSFAYN